MQLKTPNVKFSDIAGMHKFGQNPHASRSVEDRGRLNRLWLEVQWCTPDCGRLIGHGVICKICLVLEPGTALIMMTLRSARSFALITIEG
jgi:hypothetical protein